MVTDSDQATTNRPYGPPSNVTAVLQRLRARNLPEQIDLEYLRDSGVSEGTLTRTLFAMRFLGLVADTGQPTQALRSIHTSTDEEYRAILSGLVREAYSDVFDVIDPAEDTQERIQNFFRRFTPASQRARMVIFFLGMCREAGIPTLDVPRQRAMADRTLRARPTRQAIPHAPGKGRAGASIDRPGSQLAPALEMLVQSLPPPGSALSEQRREQWLKMAEATLEFMYPERTGADETNGAAREDTEE